MFKNVRIHLDTVVDLGEFVEFESVIGDKYSREQAERNLEELLHKFSEFSWEVIPESYSDLLIKEES